ncbi:sirohydrochlorin chelatase [Streptomyces spiroverticillatus]|uniref:Sirohydrochlorin chelatase n=1 Tax=Streptomyces finlayi TaxID=67296 RepID=A0A919C8V3_9ACTN|nr:sirohydrochlorin chelatase [Streptomyces finlayi]GHA02465.1 sirohydrochlorin chelatase [Streptomyces spiroverticillatus]GHC86671.1 sirohydrochlorin chelatase [Streptomyces finlayi]
MYAAPSPALLLIAHGSRDPRHAATVHALAERVRERQPGTRVEVSFLDFNSPSVPVTLTRLAGAGVRDVVALPLLLTRAFHAKADIPSVLDEASARLPHLRITRAEVLGPSPLLLSAVERRLYETGLRPEDKSSTGVVLASAGSTDPEAIAVIAEIARELRDAGWRSVRPAFASAALPRTEDAVRALRTDPGVSRVAVAPYVLAPGFLPDRIARGASLGGADLLAPVLGDCPEVARLVLTRHEEAARAARVAAA